MIENKDYSKFVNSTRSSGQDHQHENHKYEENKETHTNINATDQSRLIQEIKHMKLELLEKIETLRPYIKTHNTNYDNFQFGMTNKANTTPTHLIFQKSNEEVKSE